MSLSNKSILFLILLVAAALRFVDYFELPFTHDEFSALERLNFESFSELIEKGVKVDGHPAGIQIFLFYWTSLFGKNEWIVKLPFTIMGIESVCLIYLIGQKWFNETVGLISASYLASTQFVVLYSQIARPYISGLFFSMLMVYYWTKIIQNPNQNLFRNIIIYII
ncbi:MAG: glycosyltransferase family 39 protein [Prolixibacteraceae bacterium]|nr:glycosyltransferase family 39 protein [Prolixibacteraceae bacterium]